MTTKSHIQEQLLLWDAAVIRVIDVRHRVMVRGQRLRDYRLPASAFVYAVRGGARMTLDGAPHEAQRFYVMHGGKGACVDIEPTDDRLEFYFVFYKGTVPEAGRRELLRLFERHDPFGLSYGFAPTNPALLLNRAVAMLEAVRMRGTLDRLNVKSLFYQFVNELLRQMEEGESEAVRPKLAEQVVRYIEAHYAEPITRESLADLFHYSVPYLSKQFRRETGDSVIDYLIHARIRKAVQLLEGSELSIQEVAASVGYRDVSYFNRIFKKTTGMTPNQCRMGTHGAPAGFDRPVARRGSSIVASGLRFYTDRENENHNQHNRRRHVSVVRNRSARGVSVLLCLIMLLAACSNASPGGTGGSGNQASGSTASSTASSNVAEGGSAAAPSSQQAEATASASSDTITYHAVNGDVQIPKNPKRIVVVAGAYAGYLLTLGIKPIAVGEEAFHNYNEGKLDGVENIGSDVPVEKILELQPDLILIWDGADQLEKLTKIAPTVALAYGVPVRDQLREFGKMTGRESQAEAWIDSWDEKIAEYKPLVTAAVGDKTVSIFDSSSAKEFYAYGSFGRGGDIIYGEFGLKAPPIIQKEAIDSGTGWAKLTLELLPEYAGDYIFISGWTGSENPEPVFQGSIWDNLPAVKNGRVYRNDTRGFIYSDPISLEAELTYVVDSLTKG
ncbi:AraC family transcriptional regulator [Cohnella sp. GCM10012308]|uniref:AraC family transcriptional regulator n=1 Tax=Cohnella sp. GCM10012308 TaxID=3317329 RepID=UPI00360E2294